MARYERDPRAEPGETLAPGAKVRMRRDKDGKLVPVREPADPTVATTEASERPPFPEDPNVNGSMPPGYR
jgi:hypothetical protein